MAFIKRGDLQPITHILDITEEKAETLLEKAKDLNKPKKEQLKDSDVS